MISAEHPRPGLREPLPARHFGRTLALVHGAAIIVISMLALGAYVTLERSISVQRSAANTVGLADRQRMLSQRIASLSAQYALGNVAVRHDLRAAVDAFEFGHGRLVAGDNASGITSAVRDPQLRGIYFDAGAPLDAAAIEFIARARRIAALTPGDPGLAANSAPLFSAAQQPLLDGLEQDLAIRRQRLDAQLMTLRFAAAAICTAILAALLGATLGVFRPIAQRLVGLSRYDDIFAQPVPIESPGGILETHG